MESNRKWACKMLEIVTGLESTAWAVPHAKEIPFSEPILLQDKIKTENFKLSRLACLPHAIKYF